MKYKCLNCQCFSHFSENLSQYQFIPFEQVSALNVLLYVTSYQSIFNCTNVVSYEIMIILGKNSKNNTDLLWKFCPIFVESLSL